MCIQINVVRTLNRPFNRTVHRPVRGNLVMHYRFTDGRFLSVSSAAIVQVFDQSGTGRHSAVQSTTTARAQLTNSEIAGLPAAVFDGGDSYTLPASTYFLANQANTVVVVAKRASEDATVDGIIGFRVAGTGFLQMQFTATAGSVSYRNSTGTAVTVTGLTNTNYQVFVGSRSETTQRLAANNGTEVTSTAASSSAAVDAVILGAASSGFALTGGLAELLVFSRDLLPYERQQIARDLKTKYGL